MLQIEELTIDKVHSSYRNNTYTCRQLVQAYFERINSVDKTGPKLNALLAHSDKALEEADTLDNYFKTNSEFVGPLHGIPIIVKDQCDTIGIETTYGNICCKHVPTEDATLVRKLKEAGAVILAKSTMPGKLHFLMLHSYFLQRLSSIDFAASFNSASSISGETLNPYDTSRETGGSSAGTGAAIAANYAILGVGEDTGGSIRVPASFCNLVGLRPTVGLISRSGLSPLVKTQDTPGPMTRTVRDAALMLDVLVGYDPADSYTAAVALAGPPRGGSYAANLSEERLSHARIGILHSVFGDETTPECAEVNKVIRSTLEKFTVTGATLVNIDIPNLEYYLSITLTYLSRSRYDIDSFLKTRPHINATVESIYASKSFHPALPLFKSIATGISDPYDDPIYAKRLDERDEFQRRVMGIIIQNNLDAIAYPTVQIPAPTIKDVVGTRFDAGFPTNTVIGSQLKMPAISIPVGFTTDSRLPVGLELLGLPYQEQLLLELAFGVEALTEARNAPVL
jgi:Asp-tRNA(Asn)/Glu-tRNA(Gln) amidotransferase A subunit family amidase